MTLHTSFSDLNEQQARGLAAKFNSNNAKAKEEFDKYMESFLNLAAQENFPELFYIQKEILQKTLIFLALSEIEASQTFFINKLTKLFTSNNSFKNEIATYVSTYLVNSLYSRHDYDSNPNKYSPLITKIENIFLTKIITKATSRIIETQTSAAKMFVNLMINPNESFLSMDIYEKIFSSLLDGYKKNDINVQRFFTQTLPIIMIKKFSNKNVQDAMLKLISEMLILEKLDANKKNDIIAVCDILIQNLSNLKVQDTFLKILFMLIKLNAGEIFDNVIKKLSPEMAHFFIQKMITNCHHNDDPTLKATRNFVIEYCIKNQQHLNTLCDIIDVSIDQKKEPRQKTEKELTKLVSLTTELVEYIFAHQSIINTRLFSFFSSHHSKIAIAKETFKNLVNGDYLTISSESTHDKQLKNILLAINEYQRDFPPITPRTPF